MSGLGLTDPQMRALEAVHVISEAGDDGRALVSPKQVARRLWPNSAAWDRRPRRQNGNFGGLGATMPMKAGKLLWALKRHGLVDRPDPALSMWIVTARGQRIVGQVPQTLPIPDLGETP